MGDMRRPCSDQDNEISSDDETDQGLVINVFNLPHLSFAERQVLRDARAAKALLAKEEQDDALKREAMLQRRRDTRVDNRPTRSLERWKEETFDLGSIRTFLATHKARQWELLAKNEAVRKSRVEEEMIRYFDKQHAQLHAASQHMARSQSACATAHPDVAHARSSPGGLKSAALLGARNSMPFPHVCERFQARHSLKRQQQVEREKENHWLLSRRGTGTMLRIDPNLIHKLRGGT